MTAASSGQKFEKRIADFLRARFPYLCISAWEENRVISLIESVARDEKLIRTPRKVIEWSLIEGMAGPRGEDTQQALKALEFVDRCQEPAIFVFKDFHVFFGANNARLDIQVVR
ncbi:MAG: ATPase, partial [Candidatus Accumulibacter sp.]|nr:ATPase [Accumulibacter sp.]